MIFSSIFISFMSFAVIEAIGLGDFQNLSQHQCLYDPEYDTFHCNFWKDRAGKPWGFHFDVNPVNSPSNSFNPFDPKNLPNLSRLKKHTCSPKGDGTFDCEFKFNSTCPDGNKCSSWVHVVPPSGHTVEYVSGGARYRVPAWVDHAHAAPFEGHDGLNIDKLPKVMGESSEKI